MNGLYKKNKSKLGLSFKKIKNTMILICLLLVFMIPVSGCTKSKDLSQVNEMGTDTGNFDREILKTEENMENRTEEAFSDDIFYWGAEEYFYLLEGEWVATEYVGLIRDSHFDEASEEAYQEEVQDHTNEVIETYLGSEYDIEISNLKYLGPYVDLTFIMEDDQELLNITRFIPGDELALTPAYIGLSAQLADKPERYQFIIDAEGIVLIEIDHRFFKLEKKSKERSEFENPYFYSQKECFLSADIQYVDFEIFTTIKGELKLQWLKEYDNGNLYKLMVEADDNITDWLGEERLNIYFYITEENIYRLWSYAVQNGEVIEFHNNDDLLMETLNTDGKLIENGELVCCMDEKTDELEYLEAGSHVTITQKEEQITYNRVDIGTNGNREFYESFVWEKGKGLVEYKSGYRVESEILYIENIHL